MAKILLLEDDPDILEVLSIFVRFGGHEAITAPPAHDLIEKIRSYNPDLVIIDIRLQGINGKELCKAIKSNPLTARVPIILTSASTELLKDFETCQADDMLEKPFEMITVIDKINALVKG